MARNVNESNWVNELLQTAKREEPYLKLVPHQLMKASMIR